MQCRPELSTTQKTDKFSSLGSNFQMKCKILTQTNDSGIFRVLDRCRTSLHLHAWPDQTRKNLLDHLRTVHACPGRVLVHLPLHLLAKHSSHNIGGVNRYETEIVVKQIFKFNPIGPYAFHSRFQIHNELVTWQCLIISCCNFCYLSYFGGSTIWVFDWAGSLG